VSHSVGSKEVGTYFKFVAELEDGRYVSIFDGTTEYRLTELLQREVRAGYILTPYFFMFNSKIAVLP
jgi:hypothetical protein